MRRSSSGFTLLEVMVAVAILSTTLVVLLQIVTNNVRATKHAKLTTAATFLARNKMSDIEDQVLYEGFSTDTESAKGTFKDEGKEYERFRWETNIERIELPTDLTQQTQDKARDTSNDAKDPMAMMTGFLGGMMSAFIEPIKNGLQESVRKITVRVIWDESGRADQTIEVVQYLTDPSQLEKAGLVAPGGTPPGTKPPTTTPPTTTPPPTQMTMRRASSGFTMIELMLALAIFALITTIMFGSFSQTASSKRVIQSEQERTHAVRVALMRMTREIEMAYLSDNENTSIANRRTLFVGSARVDVDELMFSTFAHQRLRAGAAEGDTSLISYFGARDPDDRRILNLMRRETRRLQAEDPATLPGEAYILCPDVSKVKFAYYDHKKKDWATDWSTLDASGMLYLPTHVRITLTILDQRGREVSYSTDARIQLTEKVGYRNVAQ